MVNNGGYAIIDATGLDITKGSTEQSIAGSYAQCVKALASGKPVLAINAVCGEYGAITPIPVFCWYESTNIVLTASTLQIVVTSSNVVTVRNAYPNNTRSAK